MVHHRRYNLIREKINFVIEAHLTDSTGVKGGIMGIGNLAGQIVFIYFRMWMAF